MPIIVVAILCILSLLQTRTSRILGGAWLAEFLTLHEAEALDAGVSKPDTTLTAHLRVEDITLRWKIVLLSLIAFAETFSWLAVACYMFSVGTSSVWNPTSFILIATTWLYAGCRPILKPQSTPPYDLFLLFSVHLISGILLLSGIAYSNDVFATPLPGAPILVGLLFNLVAILGGLFLIASMPMGTRSNLVKKSDLVG